MLSTVLPKMTVEQRDSHTAHGLTPPQEDYDFLNEQLKEAIQLNQDALKNGWQSTTLDLLKKYIPVESIKDNEIEDATFKVCGYNGWGECAEFVVFDMCSEFFNTALKYCLKTGQKHQSNKDFIDGSGIGYLKLYLEDVKLSLERCFDAKYFFKLQRPLEWANDQNMDLSTIANAIHPGHWSYPAGHGTKFFQVVATLNKCFHLTDKCHRQLMIVAGVLAMARSGNLIHYPMDNCAGLELVEK